MQTARAGQLPNRICLLLQQWGKSTGTRKKEHGPVPRLALFVLSHQKPARVDQRAPGAACDREGFPAAGTRGAAGWQQAARETHSGPAAVPGRDLSALHSRQGSDRHAGPSSIPDPGNVCQAASGGDAAPEPAAIPSDGSEPYFIFLPNQAKSQEGADLSPSRQAVFLRGSSRVRQRLTQPRFLLKASTPHPRKSPGGADPICQPAAGPRSRRLEEADPRHSGAA